MEGWLAQYLPSFVVELLSARLLLILGAASILLFLASIVGIPYFLARLPADYFSRRERRALGMRERGASGWYYLAKIARNSLGVLLVLAGVAMLILPGQGLLSILVGLLLLDFPGKRRLERALIAKPLVFDTINRMRLRLGRPPLQRGSWT